ncbi:hypothetical protein BBP40_001238 [Aspergillus hancockii]|nr:hypothetical protein BBP40_001238 [Aspergillus hancockii]
MSSSFSQHYVTSRLTGEGEIRLLKIQSETDNIRDIQCNLRTVHLKDWPSYIALSYTWGPPTAEAAETEATISIVYLYKCNGRVIVITKNLHGFFQSARRDHVLSSQETWVDSLCINQQDIERASQVSFMASIYRSVDMGIAWLGEEGHLR